MTLRRDGPVDRKVGVPNGFDYELHNRNDIEKLLGDKAWAISYKDSACRCFGYMVSALRGGYRTINVPHTLPWTSLNLKSECPAACM